jgi:DNA-directed RNA polymerase sigma subunit (sigma70/sigma32)
MVDEHERDQRRRAKATNQRAVEMYRLRVEQPLSFREIGQRFGLSSERARRIIRLYAHIEGLPYHARVKRR